MKRKVIGFVSIQDPFHDRMAWSGTTYKLQEAITKAGYEVKWIRIDFNRRKYCFLKFCNKMRFGQYSKFLQSEAYWKLCAESIDMEDVSGCDCLFFPGNAQIIQFMDFEKPVINFNDATFALMLDYYWYRQKAGMRRQGNECERFAIRHSDIVIRASDWAAESVLRDYCGDPGRTYVLEFGANLDDADLSPNIPWDGGCLNILFSGVDWKRKGGKTAVETVRILNETGVKSRLMIMGIKDLDSEYAALPFVENIGFMDKNNPDEYGRYISTIRKCHLFLLPTLAECAGIVFCEASAYGLPSFTYSTGGIGNYVEDGVNGYKLPKTAGPGDFARKIKECMTSGMFAGMRDGCFNMYRDRLNWIVWSRKFRDILEQNGL